MTNAPPPHQRAHEPDTFEGQPTMTPKDDLGRDAIIDAWIEVTDERHEREVFFGTPEYSPLVCTLRALRAQAAIRRILLEVESLPDWLQGAVSPFNVTAVLPAARSDIPARATGRALRAWNHTGSLYGVLHTTEYCTYGNPARAVEAAIASLREGEGAPDALILCSSSQGFVCHDLLANLLDAAKLATYRHPIYVADAPRGLVPALWHIETLRSQAQENVLPQSVFWGYGAFWGQNIAHVPTSVVNSRIDGSLTDARSQEWCRQVARELGPTRVGVSATQALHSSEVVRAAQAASPHWPGILPRDLEIEVTTDRPFTPGWWPEEAPQPGSTMAVEAFQPVAAQCAQIPGSVNLTLGGFGDPLLHPDILELIRLARPHVRAINVATLGTGLTWDRFVELGAAGMDVLTVHFGYWGEERYREINGVDGFVELRDTVTGIRKRQLEELETSLPMIVPAVVKGLRGDGTLVDFYTYWTELLCQPLVINYKTWGGRLENQQALDLFPATRRPCVRMNEQLRIRADGKVPRCIEDVECDDPLGNAFTEKLADVWKGKRATAIRACHRAADYAGAHQNCVGCREWFQLC